MADDGTVTISKPATWDPRLIQSSARYAVAHGAASVNTQAFSASTATSAQHVYPMTIPSLSTGIDRAAQWQCTTYLAVTLTVGTPNSTAMASTDVICDFGKDLALASYPNSRLVSSASLAINDSSVSVNYALVLPQLVRLLDSEELRSTATCPSKGDVFAAPAGGVALRGAAGAATNAWSSSPFTDWSGAGQAVDVGNGAWSTVWFTDSAGARLTGSVTGTAAGTTYRSNGVPTWPTGTLTTVSYTIYLAYTTTEPIFCSPFLPKTSGGDEHPALYGVNAMALTMQMRDAATARVLRFLTEGVSATLVAKGGKASITSVAINTAAPGGGFSNPQILLGLLTPQSTSPTQDSCIVPYYDVQAANSTAAANAFSSTVTKSQIQSSVVVLPQIPELLILSLRPPAYALDEGDWQCSWGDVISQSTPLGANLSISFNNVSGLLSSFTLPQLYALTAQNVAEVMPYTQWLGTGIAGSTVAPYNTTQVTQGNGAVQLTSGDIVLRFGKDIPLGPGDAPGVGGSYTLYVTCNAYNPAATTNWRGANTTTSLSSVAYTPTLVITTISTGLFECRRGKSTRSTTLLSQEDVLAGSASGEALVPNSNLLPVTLSGGGIKRSRGAGVRSGAGGSMSGGGVRSGAGASRFC